MTGCILNLLAGTKEGRKITMSALAVHQFESSVYIFFSLINGSKKRCVRGEQSLYMTIPF